MAFVRIPFERATSQTGSDAPSRDADDHATRRSTRANDARERFSEIVLPHLDAAYALALWLAGNRTDAEDVVQEACVRAFRGIDGFAGGNAQAWVLTIVRNTAYSWISKNRPSSIVGVDDLEEAEARARGRTIDMETAEAALIRRHETLALESAIAELPPLFREVVVLRDLQGLSYRRISAVCGVPIGTVMSRLARARRRLTSLIRSR